MSDLVIRPLLASDRAQWQRLWEGYLAFYSTTLELAMIDLAWDRLLAADDGEFAGLLALKDGVAVGLTHYLYHRHGWKKEQVCYLQDLYVDPGTRGTGAGRALIEAVYKQADTDGASAVYWLTQAHNTTARQLYDRLATLTPFVKYSR